MRMADHKQRHHFLSDKVHKVDLTREEKERNLIAERVRVRQLILTMCAGMECRAYSEKC